MTVTTADLTAANGKRVTVRIVTTNGVGQPFDQTLTGRLSEFYGFYQVTTGPDEGLGFRAAEVAELTVLDETGAPRFGPRQVVDAKREATHLALWAKDVSDAVTYNEDLTNVEALLLSIEATAARLRALTARASA